MQESRRQKVMIDVPFTFLKIVGSWEARGRKGVPRTRGVGEGNVSVELMVKHSNFNRRMIRQHLFYVARLLW